MIYRFALFTTVMSFLLIIAGGLVTSTGSGLSVPDWPLSYGTLFPPMVGGIRFEHTHRMIAGMVGLLTLILAIWLFVTEPRRSVRWLGIGAFGLIVLQALLGGLTVLWQLPPAVSVLHACLGQTFFATMVVLTMTLSPGWMAKIAYSPTSFPSARLPILTTTVLYAQLILGAILRHTGSGLGYHLSGALAVVGCVILLALSTRQHPHFKPNVRLLEKLLGTQLILGGLTFFRRGAVLISTAHVAVGALLLSACASLTVRVLRSRGLRPLSIYLELTKPRLTSLAVFMALGGFLLGCVGSIDPWKLFAAVLGTLLVGGGAGALNQVLEQDADAKMQRTRARPLPSGRIDPDSALAFGVILCVTGLLVLTFGTNPLAGSLAVFTLGSYLFLYTPMKRRSALCTLVGAIPGATPPLIGWAASHGSLSLEAWLLFAILFLWQLPHFLAIAWNFRQDYERAGFKMLPVLDPAGGLTFRQITLYCLALVPVSLLPCALGFAGWVYFLGALVSSLVFLSVGLLTARVRSADSARRLFLVSLLYLPSLMMTMTLDRVIS